MPSVALACCPGLGLGAHLKKLLIDLNEDFPKQVPFSKWKWLLPLQDEIPGRYIYINSQTETGKTGSPASIVLQLRDLLDVIANDGDTMDGIPCSVDYYDYM